MSEVKQYAQRDLMGMDSAGNHYCRHVSAMTREQLHSKSDIAAELGWRDMQIAALEAKVKQLEWDSVFIPKDIEAALAVMGVALPESKEEFNFSINRWVQRLVDRVIRVGPELDAERNNLRAEGAASVGTLIRACAHEFPDGAQDIVQECEMIADNLAIRLRAGEPS